MSNELQVTETPDVIFNVDDISYIPVPGPQGPEGKSAYEVAVDEGYVGTEEEWLASLVGPAGPAGIPGKDGSDGFSPEVEVTQITGGHKVEITDAEGKESFDVLDGSQGPRGESGPAGSDGFSPVVSTQSITGGTRVNIEDSTHTESFDVLDGKDGQPGSTGPSGKDGVSPEVTISSITGGHRVNITDADHPSGQNFDVLDGVDGQDGSPGADGFTPVISVQEIQDGYELEITNATKTTTIDIYNGQDGQPGAAGSNGVSPEVTISTITGGHRVNITDAEHPSGQNFDVLDGSQGPQGPAGQDAQLTILSYGHSTWNDFITAYANNLVIYCRASSGSDPGSGSQTRLAFMAYVNNANNPSEVEFQYYRSVNSHSDAQQGDQVFVYKLTSAGTWTVTTRNTFTKIAAGSGLSSTWANGVLTLNLNLSTWQGGAY